jgi:hypothetical protein
MPQSTTIPYDQCQEGKTTGTEWFAHSAFWILACGFISILGFCLIVIPHGILVMSPDVRYLCTILGAALVVCATYSAFVVSLKWVLVTHVLEGSGLGGLQYVCKLAAGQGLAFDFLMLGIGRHHLYALFLVTILAVIMALCSMITLDLSVMKVRELENTTQVKK